MNWEIGGSSIKNFSIFTLGCRVNQNEEENIAYSFITRGYTLCVGDSRYNADIIIINTCAVTKMAEQKCRQLIRKIHRINENGKIVITGCYGQRAKGELLAIDGVVLVTGTGEKNNLASILQSLTDDKSVVVSDISHVKEFSNVDISSKEESRVRSYLKIQDGCEQFCTYCIIPYLRGPVRSRHYDDIIKESMLISEEGFKELVLIGIHTGFYGNDLDEDITIIDVLKGILANTNIPRIRMSSIEPTEVTDELIELMAQEDRLCKYLHIPLQSGDDHILSMMGRHYNGQYYIDLANKIYSHMPNCVISADVMTGFPGETDEYFSNTVNVIKKSKLAFIHPFPYSSRPGTKAALMTNQIEKSIKHKRQKELLKLSEKEKEICYNTYIGKYVTLLVEGINSDNLWHGHSENFLDVYFTADVLNLRGELVRVHVTQYVNGQLIGNYVGR